MKDKIEFYKQLAGRKVWIPCSRNEEGGLNLELLQSGKGEKYIPAFYEKASAAGQFSDENLVQLDFLTLRHIFLELPEDICGIAVEPFGENFLFDRVKLMDFDSQTKGMSVSRNPRRGKVKLMVPGKLPPGLENALRQFFAGQIGVNRAWVLLAKSDMEKFPHLMFAVDFYGSKIELFPKLAEVIKPFMKPGQQFELIEKDPMIDEPKFAKAMVYKRESRKQ